MSQAPKLPYEENPRHLPLLDGLRAFAILCVLTEHFGGMLAKVNSFGYYGVDLFFVLSGFLITRILLTGTGSFAADLRTFIGRRTIRIFPAYYLVLLVLYLVSYRTVRDDFLWLVTYTWNYAPQRRDGAFYLWSLSVEEQFYLFWPLLVLAFRGRPVGLFSMTLVLISLSYAQLIWGLSEVLSQFNYTGLPNRMGSLCLGASGAITVLHKRVPQSWFESRFLELLLLAALFWCSASLRFSVIPFHVLAYPTSGLCSLVLVLKCAHGRFAFAGLQRALASRAAAEIGRVSYAMYLLHEPLGRFIADHVFGPLWHALPFELLGPLEKLRWHSWVLQFPLVLLSSFLAARLMWVCYERPLLRLKDLWFPTARQEASATSPAS